MLERGKGVAVVNGEEHHGLCRVPFSSDPPNVVVHLSMLTAPHFSGGGGGDLSQDVFNLNEKGHYEPLLFQLLECNRAQFLDRGCPCCFWDALIMLYF